MMMNKIVQTKHTPSSPILSCHSYAVIFNKVCKSLIVCEKANSKFTNLIPDYSSASSFLASSSFMATASHTMGCKSYIQQTVWAMRKKRSRETECRQLKLPKPNEIWWQLSICNRIENAIFCSGFSKGPEAQIVQINMYYNSQHNSDSADVPQNFNKQIST